MSKRRVLVAAGVVAMVAAVAAWLAANHSGPARPTSGDQIIAFGDSLVEGVGATPGADMVSVLSRRLGIPIVNAGRRGDTTEAALARLDAAVLSGRPRVVLILLGGNDILRRVPRATTLENLRTIVDRIRARGAAVVLATIELDFFAGPDDSDYEALAAGTSSALVPDILAGMLGRRELMADGIHPNNRGYELMADRIEPVLRGMIE
jgi:lysophospholipase L1-like esterase